MNPRLLILAFASFAVGTETYVFAGLLARLAADLQVSIATAGQLASAFALVYAVCAPIAAVLVGHRDRKLVLVAALLALSVLNLAASFVPSFGGLLTVRMLCAVAATMVIPVAGATATMMVPEAMRGRAMAVVLSGLTLAFLLGIPLGTVIGGQLGWRASFVFSSGLAAVAAIAIGLVLPRVPSADQTGFRGLAIALRRSVLLNLSFTVAAFTAMFCVIAFIGPVVTQIIGAEGSRVGLMQSVVGVGSLLGIVIGGRLADRPGSHRAVAAALSLMALTLATYSMLMMAGETLALWQRKLMLAVMIVAGSGSLFSLTPVVQARLIGAAPQGRNVVLAFNGAMIYLGQGLGAVLGGATVALGGLAYLGMMGSAIAVGGVLLALASAPRGRLNADLQIKEADV